MQVGIVSNGKPFFKRLQRRLERHEVDALLGGASDEFFLEDRDGEQTRFVAFTQAGLSHSPEPLNWNVLVTRKSLGQPDTWLSGEIVLAAYGNDGELRGITDAERHQLAVWNIPGWNYPLLMVARPDEDSCAAGEPSEEELRDAPLLIDLIERLSGPDRRWWEDLRVVLPSVAERIEQLPVLSVRVSSSRYPGDRGAEANSNWIRLPPDLETADYLQILNSFCRKAEPGLERVLNLVLPGSLLDAIRGPRTDPPYSPEPTALDSPPCKHCDPPEGLDLQPEVSEEADLDCAKCGIPLERCEWCQRWFRWDVLYDRVRDAHCQNCKVREFFWRPFQQFLWHQSEYWLRTLNTALADDSAGANSRTSNGSQEGAMTIAKVQRGKIYLTTVEQLDPEKIQTMLGGEIEETLLEGPDSPRGPFVGFTRKGGRNASYTDSNRNVRVTRLYTDEPEMWLGGPVIVAVYREDGSLRGLSAIEQEQLQVWRSGPGYRDPLLMVADPE